MNVPKLRFKDGNGQDFPDWEEKTFSQANIRVIDGDRGENYPNGSDFSGEGYCLFLNAKNVTKSGFLFNEVSFITKQKDEVLRKGKLIRNDLIITTRGTVGNIAYYDENIKYENMRINSGMVIIRNDSANIDPNYLYKYFYSPRFRKTLEQIAFGSAQPQLTVAEINKFKIGIPIIKEQTKIADFLITIDEKIAQLTQKCELLALYKKGVMQKLFSQELRFKEDGDRNFPDWENVCFGDVATFYNGRAYKQSEWEDNGIPVIRLQNLTGSSTNYYYSNIKLPENQYCNQGDLLYMWSATFGPVWWNGDKAIYHYHIWKIKTNLNQLSKNYLYYILDYITDKMKNTSNGSTMLHITKGGIEKLRIDLPYLQEQIKIANFLITIDEKITQSQTYLDTVKQYKQGLLQQMFI